MTGRLHFCALLLVVSVTGCGEQSPSLGTADANPASSPQSAVTQDLERRPTNQEVAQDLAELISDADLRGYNMDLKYQRGRATLIGDVSTAKDKETALALALQHPSVDTVEDQLTIRR